MLDLNKQKIQRRTLQLGWLLFLLSSFPLFAITTDLDVVEVDPTRPAKHLLAEEQIKKSFAMGQGEEQSLKLSTVFFGGKSKVAIINGMLLKEGDAIAGRKILKINEGSVTLIKFKSGDATANENAEVFELEMLAEDIKEPMTKEKIE